jgi:IS30 family transposase
MSARAISQEVGVYFSTISQELRISQVLDGYDPHQAHRLCDERRRTASKAMKYSEKIDDFIKVLLTLRWSPEAMSQRLKLEVPSNR